MIFAKYRKRKGFTVVEALVAIGILVLAISGGFAAISLSLNRSNLSKEQVTAFYLAQEAMELFRSRRDSNSMQGLNWLDGIADTGDPCANNTICRIDPIAVPSGNWYSCGASWGSCPALRNSGSPGYLYGYNGAWNATIFTREIQVRTLGVDVIEVEVRVTWPHGGDTEQFVANGIFYDWQ